MTTWTKETKKILLEMWNQNNLDEIAKAVNNWHIKHSQSKGSDFAPTTTARGAIYQALKLGLVTDEEVKAFDKNQRIERAKLSYISNELNNAVQKRDGNQCLMCGTKENLQATHIIPISRGGISEMDNLQTLCLSCRKDKHTSIVDFRKPYVKEWCSHCGRTHFKNIE